MCPCTPWVGLNGFTISSHSEGSSTYDANEDCTWTISGVNPRVTFCSCDTEGGYDYVYVDECVDAECTRAGASLAEFNGPQLNGLSYESSTSYLRLHFTSDAYVTRAGFAATVSGGLPGCAPCGAGTYKAGSSASECTGCPTNAVSAEGSSSCVCLPGYSGDAGVGEDCVLCEAGAYLDLDASRCTACPTNAVSAQGSAALSS